MKGEEKKKLYTKEIDWQKKESRREKLSDN